MRPAATLMTASLLALVSLTACGSDASPGDQQPVSEAPMGGDVQPPLADVVRVGLTKKQVDLIAEGCRDAQEITTDGECREDAFPEGPSVAPSPFDPCELTDYCMIVDRRGDEVVITKGDPPVDASGDDVDPDSVLMRLDVTEEVLTDIVTDPATPPTSDPATPTDTAPTPTDPTPTGPDETELPVEPTEDPPVPDAT